MRGNLFRYVGQAESSSSSCDEADKAQQRPLGLDNTALPFSLIPGAAVLG